MMDLRHCRRGKGRSKTSWTEVTRGDLNFLGLIDDMTQDRSLWSFRIKSVEHIDSAFLTPPLGPLSLCASSEGWRLGLVIGRACVGFFFGRVYG